MSYPWLFVSVALLLPQWSIMASECNQLDTLAQSEIIEVLTLPQSLDEPHFYYITDTDYLVLYIHPEAISQLLPHQSLAPALGALPLIQHTEIFQAVVQNVPNYNTRVMGQLNGMIPHLLETGKVAIFNPRKQQFLSQIQVIRYTGKHIGRRVICVPFIGDWVKLFSIEEAAEI